jgi:hypothetical protein
VKNEFNSVLFMEGIGNYGNVNKVYGYTASMGVRYVPEEAGGNEKVHILKGAGALFFRVGIVPIVITLIEKEVIQMWWWVATIIVWLFSAA